MHVGLFRFRMEVKERSRSRTKHIKISKISCRICFYVTSHSESQLTVCPIPENFLENSLLSMLVRILLIADT